MKFSVHVRRWQERLCVGGALLLTGAGCVSPTNPCDPETSPTSRQTSSIAGRVLDEQGAPVANVTIAVTGRGETTVSQTDGSYVLEGLPPNDGETPYELTAIPEAPALGGKIFAPPLGCVEDLQGVDLRVAIPPSTPEVEVVRATAPDRFLVAFASVFDPDVETMTSCSGDEGTGRYQVEVREPFGLWQPALLAPTPNDAADNRSHTDACAADLCRRYAYAIPELQSARARCVEVVGVVDDTAASGMRPLTPLGDYQIRVSALRTASEVARAQKIPSTLRSMQTAVPASSGLLPTSMMPVPLDPDPATSESLSKILDVECVLPVGRARFAVLDRGSLRVLGQAATFAADAYADASDVAEETLALDHSASAACEAEMSEEQGEALAVLPAGRWVRVWKHLGNSNDSSSAKIEKIFVGTDSVDEDHGPAGPETRLDLDITVQVIEDAFRGFSWLTKPVGPAASYSPPDSYLVMFRRGFVMVEREDPNAPHGALLASGLEDDFNPTGANFWNYVGGIDGAIGQNFLLHGFCDLFPERAQEIRVENDGNRVTRMCVNLAAAYGLSLNLVDIEILASDPEDFAPQKTVHVFADESDARLLAVPTMALTGHGSGSLVDAIQEVQVGVSPIALSPSRTLTCEDQTAFSPVLLVANAGSRDISVITVTDPDNLTVEEVAVIPLPATPATFFMDPDGPSCTRPYVWVLTDDARAFPLDMRRDRLGIPSCGDAPCQVATEGRASSGAINRSLPGADRVLLGGRGMISEIGYLRRSKN